MSNSIQTIELCKTKQNEITKSKKRREFKSEKVSLFLSFCLVQFIKEREMGMYLFEILTQYTWYVCVLCSVHVLRKQKIKSLTSSSDAITVKRNHMREKVKGITKNIYDSNRQGDRTENATLRVHFFDCDHTYIFVKEIVNNLLELSSAKHAHDTDSVSFF